MGAPRGAVVVGVDDGPDARRALWWAAAEAERREAPLHLLHALAPARREVPRRIGEQRWLRARADRLVSEAAECASRCSTVPLSTEVVESAAEPALVTASVDALMVVVGARGHSLGYHVLVGSVSLHLAHYAQAPLVTVREQADPTSRQVVVGVDGSAESAAALRFAFETASAQRLPLVALHGWRSPAQEPGDETAAAVLDEAVAAWATRYPVVPATAKVMAGRADRLLIEASAHARLVVVGARGRNSRAEVRLGPVSEAVLHHARSPVAIAR
jgi:nucleotide-binding universal stress UspA family protein